MLILTCLIRDYAFNINLIINYPFVQFTILDIILNIDIYCIVIDHIGFSLTVEMLADLILLNLKYLQTFN